MLLRLSVPNNSVDGGKPAPDPKYGRQLQDKAIQGHAAEGKVQITYTEVPMTLADGTVVTLRQPMYKIGNPRYGKPHTGLMVSPRVAPQLIGLGLLEAIPSKEILARVDPDDRDNDTISGRANLVWSVEQNKAILGRFGWKAGQPTVRRKSADAFSRNMGLSTTAFKRTVGRLHHHPNGVSHRSKR